MVDSTKNIKHKLLIVLHVRSVYLQQIVKTARDVIALRHLWYLLNDAHEVMSYLSIELLHLDIAKHDKASIQLFSVKYRHILLYITTALQTPLPLKDWSGGKIDLLGKLLDSESAVILQGTRMLMSVLSNVSAILFEY